MGREGQAQSRDNSGANSPHITKLGDILTASLAYSGVEGVSVTAGASSHVEQAADLRNTISTNLRARERWVTEVNLQRLPFAALWDKKTGSMDPIVVEQTYYREGTFVQRRWQVLPGSKMGMPGPSAYATFRALEKILLTRTIGRGKPLTNPQEFEFQEICRELDLAYDDENLRRIRDDLRRIADAKFVDEGFLREKKASEKGRRAAPPKRQSEARLSLLSQLVFIRDMMPDGSNARTNTVWLGDFYLASVNSGYIKPLNWDLWKSLPRPAARRIYELVDLKLFATPHAPVLEFDYDDLTQLVPFKRERYPGDARWKLNRILECLVGKVLDRLPDDRNQNCPDWFIDGSVWSVRLTLTEDYRKSGLTRAIPQVDVRALELSKELGDHQSLPFFQKVVTSVDRLYIDIALSETKTAALAGKVKNRAAYFTEVLAAQLIRRRLPVPFTTESQG